MLLEFRLPSGSGGMAAGYTYQAITRQIKEINHKHNLHIVEHLREGYKYVVECTEQEYTMLCLTWTAKNQWQKWRVIEASDLGEQRMKTTVKPGESPIKRS